MEGYEKDNLHSDLDSDSVYSESDGKEEKDASIIWKKRKRAKTPWPLNRMFDEDKVRKWDTDEDRWIRKTWTQLDEISKFHESMMNPTEIQM
mmetsp:Transcript_36633/g.43781  ORF Transcript_36633/g.43781 Transcript_36633/m.43781 type:complete len:92 (-) Transcript_36633:23-298(-)